ncbi:hypothetical protein GALL_413520 [mine drainage metagenome]|uniref:S1-like domain-containing protein n=1 Tax=mine drainage metagenome TaxID=410659 RepID=A0A1J5PZV5_9ZZZZ
MVGIGCHVQGDFHRLGKALKAAIVAAGFRQLVQPALGILDLRARRKVDRGVKGDVDHVFADPDQIAAKGQFIDCPPIILGVDDGGGFGGEAGEVLANRHAADVGFGRQKRLQRDRGCDLAHPDQAAGRLVNSLVDRFEEMLGFEKVRYPVKRIVVDQDRAQQALFRLDIVRCAPVDRNPRVRGELENVRRIKWGHGDRVFLEFWRMRGTDKAPVLWKAEARARRLCTVH